ncbi:TPA: hypothetical protein ACH3X1_007844 [Trebouxia sp. C0004]
MQISFESSHSHPGSIAMVGDFNNHYFYPPPPSYISTLHSLPTILEIQAKRTLDTPMSRAATVAHVKTTLQNLCNQIQDNQAALLLKVLKRTRKQNRGRLGWE